MIEEADDRCGLFELRFHFWNQREWLRIHVIEIEDDEGRFDGLGSIEAGDDVLVALDKLYFDAEFARGFLNFGLEEQVVDKAEDAGWRVFADGLCRLVGVVVRVAIVVRDRDGRRYRARHQAEA